MSNNREWTTEFTPFNSWKAATWGEHFEGIKKWQLKPPVVLNLDIAGGWCQCNCRYCHHPEKTGKLILVPKDILLQIPEFVSDWGVKAACIVGTSSDATYHPALGALLKSFHYNKIDVGLVSNGLRFTDRLKNYTAFYTKFLGFSIDCATPDGYNKLKRIDGKNFDVVIDNLSDICRIVNDNAIRNDIGYKFLIFPETYHELYEAAKIAKEIGCRYLQCRPAELPDEARSQIVTEEVNELAQMAMDDFNEDGVFDVVYVKHKFDEKLDKKIPEKCMVTPLTTTWDASGGVNYCVDRRGFCGEQLCNYIEEGLHRVKELWGSAKHYQDIETMNKKLHTCIRCSNYGYHKFFENVFSDEDPMDRKLI